MLGSLQGPAAGPPRAPPVPGQTEVSPNSPFLSVGAPVVLEWVSPGCLLHAGRGAGGTDSFRSPPWCHMGWGHSRASGVRV